MLITLAIYINKSDSFDFSFKKNIIFSSVLVKYKEFIQTYFVSKVIFSIMLYSNLKTVAADKKDTFVQN